MKVTFQRFPLQLLGVPVIDLQSKQDANDDQGHFAERVGQVLAEFGLVEIALFQFSEY